VKQSAGNERQTTRGHRADARAAASSVHEWVWLDAGVDAGLWVDQASALKGRRDWLKFVGCHSRSLATLSLVLHPLTRRSTRTINSPKSWGVLCCALPVCWHPCAPPGMAGDGPTREDGDQLLELGVVVTVECGLWYNVQYYCCWMTLWSLCTFMVHLHLVVQCTEMQVVLIHSSTIRTFCNLHLWQSQQSRPHLDPTTGEPPLPPLPLVWDLSYI
jgi:hypothetical protein